MDDLFDFNSQAAAEAYLGYDKPIELSLDDETDFLSGKRVPNEDKTFINVDNDNPWVDVGGES